MARIAIHHGVEEIETIECDNPDVEHPGFPCNHPATNDNDNRK